MSDGGEIASRQSSFFRSGERGLVEIWDALQSYQTDFCIAQELALYYTFRKWHQARRVIDVGTGNGYYLNRIVDLFPDKRYTGIDSSAELLAIAQARVKREQVAFKLVDFWDLTDECDFAILRLFLQHVPDVAAVLGRVARLVVPGGGAIVVDAHDPLRFFDPPVPAFSDFFRAFRSQERRAGPDKSVTSNLCELVARHPAWQVEQAATVTIPSTIPGNMDLFRKTYGLVIDMVEAVGELDYDFEQVRQEWHSWCSLERAYTQVGLNVIQLARA